MITRKQFSALILMLALVVPMLAACGGGGGGAAATSAPATGGGGTAATTAPAATNAPQATAAATAASEAGGGAMVEGATAGASGDVSKVKIEDGATILFMVNGNPTEQKLYQDGVARFNKVFPNVKVEVQLNNDQYQTKMKAAMTAGTAPDVFILDGQLMGAFASNGLLLSLDDAMSAAGVKADDYYESLIQLYQLDGKTYGIPKDFGTLVLFVNNDMAQKAGVDPASIKTWTDLQNAAQKMTSGEGAGKTFGMCLNADIERYGASLFQNGNEIIKDGKAIFNDQKGVQAIDFWYSFKQSGTGELYKELGKNWCGEAFAGKNTAMAVEGGWLVPFMADPANGGADLKYTAVPLPVPDGGQPGTWLFTNGFAVNAKSKYPNAAASLVLYLTGAQNQKALIPSGLASPSLKALASDPFFQNNPVQQVLVEQGKVGRLSDVVLGGPIKKGDVLKQLNDALESIFLGQQSTKDALDTAAQSVDQILQQK